MRTFVWVDAWQQQCCGDDFEVGSSVTWDVTGLKVSENWVMTLLGREWGERVWYVEDHHGVHDDPRFELRGVVRSIHVVTCDRTQGPLPGQPPNGGAWVAMPGTGALRPVAAADPWKPEPRNDDPHRSFEGWVVELEVMDEP